MKLLLFALMMSLSLPAFSANSPTMTRFIHLTRLGDSFQFEQCRVHSRDGLQSCTNQLLSRDQLQGLISSVVNSASNQKGMVIVGASVIAPMVLPFTAFGVNKALVPIKSLSPRFAATASLVTGAIAMAAYLYWFGLIPYKQAEATQQSAEQAAAKLKEFAVTAREGEAQDIVWTTTRVL